MRLGKRLLRQPAVRALLAVLLFAYVRLVARTTRWTVDDRALRALDAEGRGGIGAFWHGRLLLMREAWTLRPTPFYMMISRHRDGDLISRVIALMGIATVGTDKKTGGLSAMRAGKRLVDRGDWVGITPDGPKGPRMRARGGAIKLAQFTGRPVLPASVGASRGRVLGSWDRFLLVYPFGRAEIRYGRPIHVPRDADARALERCRRELEDELNRLTRELDRHFGRVPVEPAGGPPPEPLDRTPEPSAGHGHAASVGAESYEDASCEGAAGS